VFLIRNFSTGQARELSLLVELEAGWENLRVCQPIAQEQAPNVKELHQRQKAYETFRAKLMAYNKDFRPAHVPELLLNTAHRLGAWCRWMTELLGAAQHDSQAYYPVHLVEKAYRYADRLSVKGNVERINRPTLSRDIPAAIRELENLAQWCESLSPSKLAG
jgi:hypothetical protein